MRRQVLLRRKQRQLWTPLAMSNLGGYWNYRDLADGAVSAWPSRDVGGGVLRQTTAAKQPIKSAAGIVFDGVTTGNGDSLGRSLAQAKMVSVRTLPDGIPGATAGKGSTCTGAVDDPDDGTWWNCVHNDGGHPGLAHYSVPDAAGNVTLLGFIDLSTVGVTGSPQGVVVANDHTLWFTDVGGTDQILNITKAGVLTGATVTLPFTASGLAYLPDLNALVVGQRAGDGDLLGIYGIANPASPTTIVTASSTGLSEQDSLYYHRASRTLLMTYGANGSIGAVQHWHVMSTGALRFIGGILLDIDAEAVEGAILTSPTDLWIFVDGYFHLSTLNTLVHYKIPPLYSDILEMWGTAQLSTTTGADVILEFGDAVAATGYGAGVLANGLTVAQVFGQTGESAATSRSLYAPAVPTFANECIFHARLNYTAQTIELRINGVLIGSGAATNWTGPFRNAVMRVSAAPSTDSDRSASLTSRVLGFNMGAGDAQRIEGFIANDLGRQALLPATHPYKSIAPTV